MTDYQNKVLAYRQTLQQNIDIIQGMLDEALKGKAAAKKAADLYPYPNLFKCLTEYGGAKGRKLIQLHIHALQYEKPLSDKQGNLMFFVSHRHLAKLYGSDFKAWRITITLLAAMGLISIIQPRKDSLRNTQAQWEAIFLMQDKHEKDQRFKHPINYYCLPVYSTDRLMYANEHYQKFIDNGGNLKNLSKAMLIEIYGHQHADLASDNKISKSRKQLSAEKTIEAALKHNIDKLSYTTKRDIIDTARWMDETASRKIHEAAFARTKHKIMMKYMLEERRIGKRKIEALGLSSNKSMITIIKSID